MMPDTAPPLSPSPIPCNIEAEQAVLGGLMLQNEAFQRLPPEFDSHHFYDPVHARIFEAIRDRILSDKLATPVTMFHAFENDDGLKHLGGNSYIGMLADCAVAVFNIRDYAEVVIETWQQREILEVCRAGAEMIEGRAAPREAIDALQDQLGRVTDILGGAKGPVDWKTVVNRFFERFAEAHETGEDLSGVSTGLEALNAIIGGMKPTQLIILAARPAMGKTALALEISRAAAQMRHGVMFVTREMTPEQLITRSVATMTPNHGDGIPYKRFDRPQDFDQAQMAQMAQSAREIENLPIVFAGESVSSVAQIAAETRRVAQKLRAMGATLDLIVIDYLTLLRPPGNRPMDRQSREVSEITKGLKGLAVTLGVPILVLAQLNRGVESREDKRPVLSDIRESGAAEEDADIILFAYREEYYLARCEPRSNSDEYTEWLGKMADAKDLLDIIVAKQRGGPTGTARVIADLSINKIRDKQPWDNR